MIVLPLKVTKPTNLVPPLSTWLDGDSSPSSLTSTDCQSGLLRLSSTRTSVSKLITSPTCHARVVAACESSDGAAGALLSRDLVNYHAMLVECESVGFPIVDGHIDELRLEWWCAFERDSEPIVRSNIRYERLSTLYNIIALESHAAATTLSAPHQTPTKETLNERAKKYKTCVTLLQHLKQLTNDNDGSNPSIDLTANCLALLETIMRAQSQESLYDMAVLQSKHNMLAKLAMGACGLYNDAFAQSQKFGLKSRMPQLEEWSAWLRCRGILFRVRSEYHESVYCREVASKKGSGYGMEIGRLKLALDLCEQGLILVRNANLEEEGEEMEGLKRLVGERAAEAEKDNETVYREPVPGGRDLVPIRGISGKDWGSVDKALEKLEQPLFGDLLSEEAAGAMEKFEKKLSLIEREAESYVKNHSDAARSTLAEVNLPQNLSLYKASGRGFPIQLWQKVQAVQKSITIDKFKLYLWTLSDISSNGKKDIENINNLLETDLVLDREFRERYPRFSGSSVQELQNPLRQSLSQCAKLLTTANEGDKHLAKTLDMFEKDPKFELLQYNKETLDLLFPNDAKTQKVDTSELTSLLGALTRLFKERQGLLKELKTITKELDFEKTLKESASRNKNNDNDTDQVDYDELMQEALKPVTQIQKQIQANIEEQPQVLKQILHQNNIFLQERKKLELENQKSAPSGDKGQNAINMIQEALKDLILIEDQLQEGKQFYDSITPNLKLLKARSEELSAKLTYERLEYEDHEINTERQKQESTDIEFAKRIANETVHSHMTVEERESFLQQRKSQEIEDLEFARKLANEAVVSGDTPQLSEQERERQIQQRKMQEKKDEEFARLIANEAAQSHQHIQQNNIPNVNMPHPPPDMTRCRSDDLRNANFTTTHRASSAPYLMGAQPLQTTDSPNDKGEGMSTYSNAGSYVPPNTNYQRASHPEAFSDMPVDESKVALLVEMGFGHSVSVRALETHNNDVEAASNYLLMGSS